MQVHPVQSSIHSLPAVGRCKGSTFSVPLTYVREKAVTTVAILVIFRYVPTIIVLHSTYVLQKESFDSLQGTRSLSSVESGFSPDSFAHGYSEGGSYSREYSPLSVISRVRHIIRPWVYLLSPLKIGPVVMINGAVLHGQIAHQYYKKLLISFVSWSVGQRISSILRSPYAGPTGRQLPVKPAQGEQMPFYPVKDRTLWHYFYLAFAMH